MHRDSGIAQQRDACLMVREGFLEEQTFKLCLKEEWAFATARAVCSQAAVTAGGWGEAFCAQL